MSSISLEKRKEHAFSMIELLAVITIIGLLVAIAIPQFQKYRESAFLGRAKTDLRHIATAEEAYFVDYQAFRSCTNSACVVALPGILGLSEGVTLQITATATGFSGTASHMSVNTVCRWDQSQHGFMGCS